MSQGTNHHISPTVIFLMRFSFSSPDTGTIRSFLNSGQTLKPTTLMMALESLEPVISAPNARSTIDHGSRRSRTLHVSKSFSRLEPSTSSPLIDRRANVSQSEAISEILVPEKITLSPESEQARLRGDIFEKSNSDDEAKPGKDQAVISGSSVDLSEGFNDLPIELISLTDRLENVEGSKGQGSLTSHDRFIDSLTAKVYSTPPSIDDLADLFQDFYIGAAAHISTHISTLSSRQHREKSPNPSTSSRSSSTANLGNRVGSRTSKESLNYGEKPGPEQQMLTTTEIADKRRARRMLEQKRLALEEAVERRACEGVYDRIWRHRSTLDEVRDEKLRSRTAALSLVGIGLKELGVDTNPAADDVQASTSDRETQIREWLSGARKGLIKMNDERYPLGKLQHLAAAHKSIVDVLSKIQTSSSSADEILPTMIYTLLTTPQEGINIISNLHFTQRFRAVSKVDGEAAYCLTNLEAAISFLETVDLASLRADEALEGPSKSNSRPSTPLTEKIPWVPYRPSSPSLSSPVITPAVGTYSMPTTATSNKPLPSPASSRPSPPTSPLHQRRLSHLLQPSTNAIGAASDAVRTTADQGFKNISNTLDNSFKFLFGRLKEQEISGDGSGAVMIPKTLDDVRRLVSPTQQVEDNGSVSGAVSISEQPEWHIRGANVNNEDRMLDLIGGRKQTRERSVDSTQSNGSGKRASFATDNGQGNTPAALSVSAPGNAAMESMRNLGNTLNPLNRLAGMNVMRGFGRTASNTPPAIPASAEKFKELGAGDVKTPAEPQYETTRVARMAPPIQRFLDIDGPGDLKITEVTELLEDYRRLARALHDMRAFSLQF